MSSVEKIKALRDKKQEMIEKCKSQIANLEYEMQQLTAQIDGLDEAIKTLIEEHQKPEVPSLTGLGRYSKMMLTEAVADVIARFGTHPGLLVPMIIEKLKAEGFQSNGKELYSSVYVTGLRLIKQGKAVEGKTNGKRSFMRKQSL